MGCDIHAHIEVLINGQWHHWDQPKIDRNYNLFARLADVRNYGNSEPISKPRGIPDDASFIVKFDADHLGVDGRSHSHIDANELASICKEFIDPDIRSVIKFGFLFGNGYGGWVDYPEERPSNVDDVRMIFWFDN